MRELPPRARRIPNPGYTWRPASKNYLRVRGEYEIYATLNAIREELPPRARRIPGKSLFDLLKSGTTSACAENTPPPERFSGTPGNYLRVRGEYKIST